MPLSELQSSAPVKISVIVPVYNTEKYLRRCVDSILSQTFANFELLLIDDGSKDASGAICDDYAANDPRVRVFHKQNGGVSSARNFGIDNARGEWISFVDADDWLEAEMYEYMLREVGTSDAKLALCGFNEVKNGSHPVFLSDMRQGKETFIRNYFLRGWAVVWNVLIDRRSLEDSKIRFDETVKIGEDAHVLFQLFCLFPDIVIVNSPLYNYNRMNESSKLHNIAFEDYNDLMKVLLSTIEFYKQRGIFYKFEREFAWKVLIAKQDLALYPDMHKTFLSLYPESHKFILSCPRLGKKIKLMMWLLVHHLGFITKMLNRVRFWLIGNSNKY